MAQLNKPVIFPYQSGKTLWFLALNQSGLTVFNKDTLTWVTYNPANLAHYAMTMTEIGSTGIYVGFYPDGYALDNLPTEVQYQQAGVQPTLPDDLPIVGMGQSQGQNVAAINWSILSASNLQKNADSQTQGVVQSGVNTSSSIITNLSGPDNIYNGRVVIFTSGGQVKAAAIVTGFVSMTGMLTFTPIPSAPSPGDSFLVA
jgi:hypothetical protein